MDGWMDGWRAGGQGVTGRDAVCCSPPSPALPTHSTYTPGDATVPCFSDRAPAHQAGTSVPGHQALERPVHASPGAREDSAAPPPVHTALSAAICSSPREPLRTQQRQAHHQRGPRSLAHDKGTWTNRAGENTQFLATGSEISLPLAPVAAAKSRKCVCLRSAACPTTHTGYNYKVGRRQELRANDGPIETSWRA